jgi:Uncharacterized protein conserved in bacteria (DUF2184)
MSYSQSKINSYIPGRKVRPLVLDNSEITGATIAELARLGISMDSGIVEKQIEAMQGIAMDSNFVQNVTTPSIPTPVQFLQTWLPGFVHVITAARKIDELIGIQTVGRWHDQEIVQGVLEPKGVAGEYGDYTNVPLSSWNTNFEKRTVVRGDLGIQVGILEEMRAAEMRVSSSVEKRGAAAIELERFRNGIGFFGFYSGANLTYGFLNDPSLPSYVSAPTGTWATASFQQIQGDILTAISDLASQSGGNIDPTIDNWTLAVPVDQANYLNRATDLGVTVTKWLQDNYKNCRVVKAPELKAANGGANVLYVFAESIDQTVDGSTDGGSVFAQLVQTKFYTTGVEKKVKYYTEGYANATAGTLCKRPWAVVRMTGI